MTIAELTIFFGWMSVINISLLLFYVLILMTCRCCIESIHSKLFGVSKDVLPSIYMEFLGRYKILIIFFNLAPYLALRIFM